MPEASAAKPGLLAASRLGVQQLKEVEDRFEVHRLWEVGDLDGFLAGPGRTVEVITTAGQPELPGALLARFPRLRLVAVFTTGYEGLDVDWCSANGVAVTTAAAVNGHDVADLAVALALAAWRGVGEGDRLIREGRWRGFHGIVRPSLRGRRAGLVGMGAIGQAIARRLAAFELEVAWWGPNPKPDLHWPRAESLLALASASDLLVVAARATAENAHMVDAAVLDALGPDGVVVNIARGSLVDEAALVAALREGRIAGAGLDVFEEEPTPAEKWAGVPNVVLTPHLAGVTSDGMRDVGALFLDNLRRFADGRPLASPLF